MSTNHVTGDERPSAANINTEGHIDLEEQQGSIRLITESPEHHFVTILGQLKKNPDSWSIQHFQISKLITQQHDMHDPHGYFLAMTAFRDKQRTITDAVMEKAQGLEEGFVYLLTDGDIVVLSHNVGPEADNTLHDIFSLVSEYVGNPQLCKFNRLAGSFYHYQKIADEKFLLERRLEAFSKLGDAHKVGSITQRRHNREEPMIMVVEDDRFTASYAANILNKKYDMIVCRNGEEAVANYLEYAPDIVFLDIHLPGMSGHDVLKVIKSTDPHAHVVMLSVDAVPKNIGMASQEGAHGFLKKPFSKERLINTVKASPFIRAQMTANLPKDGTFVH